MIIYVLLKNVYILERVFSVYIRKNIHVLEIHITHYIRCALQSRTSRGRVSTDR